MESGPLEQSLSPFLRRLGAAARVLSAMTQVLLGEGVSSTEDFQLRCTTFALVAGFLTCAFFGTMMLLSGEGWQAFFLAVTAVLYAACIAFHRRRRDVTWTLNAMAAATWFGIVAMMCLQGGIHTPTSWWLVTLTYLLATAGLPRSAVAWLGICALTVLVFLWLEKLGVRFPQEFGSWPLLFQFSNQVSLFALIVFFALVLSAARVESTRRAEAAYREAIAASAAKSRFLATMSHEIRTPLNGVIGTADLLGTTNVSSEQRQLIDTLRYSSTHLKSLIDDILDFSRIEAGKLELEAADFDPGEVLRHTVETLAVLARSKGLECHCRLTPAVPARARGDAARLRQIVNNLVGNAIKFTAAGRVEVDVDATQGSAADRLRLVIRVSDTGIGIATEKLAKLFKAFSQADDSTTRLFGGSGLGLAISQELARRMGGEIAVDSVLGVGTTFTCWLDLGVVAHAAPLPTTPETESAPGQLSALRVLIVEDNQVNLALACAMLEQFGCEVLTAVNGRDGVDRWQQEQPDLILLDCHMPVMDGLSAAREIRHAEAGAARTPIIALTASAFAEDRAACLAAGMDDFLSKPYTFEQLNDVVRRHRRR